MGAVTGLLGLGGGAAGTSLQGPQGSAINNPTTAAQLGTAYTGTQGALSSQQQLLQALQQQNGLANQNQVYGQLQGVANGTGPNPAQAMLNQATGQNVANQAALMAGQRGANANVGLIARQAGQQGAATQQQAIGQGAALQAQQSLGAIGQAGQIAGTQASNQIGQTNANAQSQQAEQQALLNAQAGFNNAAVGTQSSINNVNGQLANTQMAGQQNLIGGVGNALGFGAALAGAAGGEASIAHPMADGGDASAFQGPQSKFGQFITGASAPPAAPNVQNPTFSTPAYKPMFGAKKQQKPIPNILAGTAQDMGTGATDMSPVAGAPDAGMMAAAKGGMTGDYRSGGKVQAKNLKQKASAPGNNYANDKIPAVLSEHEIVLPRSVTLSPDPVGNAAKFVAATLAKRRGK